MLAPGCGRIRPRTGRFGHGQEKSRRAQHGPSLHPPAGLSVQSTLQRAEGQTPCHALDAAQDSAELPEPSGAEGASQCRHAAGLHREHQLSAAGGHK